MPRRIRSLSQLSIATLELASKQGIDLATCPEAVFKRLRMEARGMDEKVRDGVSLVRSKVNVMSGQRVKPEVVEANDQICRSNRCGKYQPLAGGKRACLACQCTSADLTTKQTDIQQHCPEIDPETNNYYWDNRKYIKVTVNRTQPALGDGVGYIAPRNNAH
jgi:hypothetical protein